jgi:hypothetical protein
VRPSTVAARAIPMAVNAVKNECMSGVSIRHRRAG